MVFGPGSLLVLARAEKGEIEMQCILGNQKHLPLKKLWKKSYNLEEAHCKMGVVFALVDQK